MPNLRAVPGRVADMVREMFPLKRGQMPQEEQNLAVHLRGNDLLLKDLTELIRSRIEGRDRLPVPTDPLACKGFMERNNELRWLMAKLEYLYRSPVNPEAEQGEQPE